MLADAEAAVDDSDTGGELREFARNVARRNKRLNYLAASLRWGLSTSRRTRVKPTRHNICRVLHDVWDMFEGEATRYGCTLLRPDIRGRKIVHIEIWRDELEIALHNLVDNGIKYSFMNKKNPAQYEIRIQGHELARDKRGMLWYCVTISNLGIGIQSDELEEGLIFREGYRGAWAQDRNRSGSGIGCGVAQEIIEQRHRGRLIIESRLPRGGEDRWPTAEEIASAMRSGIGRRRTLPPYITTARVELPYYQDHEKRE